MSQYLKELKKYMNTGNGSFRDGAFLTMIIMRKAQACGRRRKLT
jgi:hypothetical protein